MNCDLVIAWTELVCFTIWIFSEDFKYYLRRDAFTPSSFLSCQLFYSRHDNMQYLDKLKQLVLFIERNLEDKVGVLCALNSFQSWWVIFVDVSNIQLNIVFQQSILCILLILLKNLVCIVYVLTQSLYFSTFALFASVSLNNLLTEN